MKLETSKQLAQILGIYAKLMAEHLEALPENFAEDFGTDTVSALEQLNAIAIKKNLITADIDELLAQMFEDIDAEDVRVAPSEELAARLKKHAEALQEKVAAHIAEVEAERERQAQEAAAAAAAAAEEEAKKRAEAEAEAQKEAEAEEKAEPEAKPKRARRSKKTEDAAKATEEKKPRRSRSRAEKPKAEAKAEEPKVEEPKEEPKPEGPKPAEAQLLSVDQVMAILNTNKKDIYNKIKSGELKAEKVGRYWKVDAASVQDLLAKA